MPLILKGYVLDQVEGQNPGGLANPGLPGKWQLKLSW